VKYAWIKEQVDAAGEFPVRAMCAALEVSRSAFYEWRAEPVRKRQAYRDALAARIERVQRDTRGVYGSPRVTAELKARGEVACCENTVAKVMRERQIRARTAGKFVPSTTDSRHDRPVAPNVLDRRFDAALPDQKWAADITYVPTDEGWLYLAGVIDLCSRRIVGWSMADHMRTGLVADALTMALSRRSPPGDGLLHHSDRGVQYASDAYQALLKANGMTCSMSRVGDCWDNAVMESFWGTLKAELTDRERYATRDQARASIFEYVEVFYNRVRRHSSLGYVSPEQFEAALN
jgi:transposase InsO family protein